MSVVQPVLVTELVFVLVLRRVWIRQDVARAAWAAVAVVCVALAVFLIVAEPTGGHPTPETAEWLSAGCWCPARPSPCWRGGQGAVHRCAGPPSLR